MDIKQLQDTNERLDFSIQKLSFEKSHLQKLYDKNRNAHIMRAIDSIGTAIKSLKFRLNGN